MEQPGPASTPDPTPGRVRVTSPLATARTHAPRSVRQEIDEASGVGEVYIRSLVRSQLRSALAVVTVLVAGVGALPLAFTLLGDLAGARVGPVPLPWIVLGVLVYPALLLVGWLYVRRAERAEADFAALVHPPELDRRDDTPDPAGVPGRGRQVDPAGVPGRGRQVDPAGVPGRGRQVDPAGVPGRGRQDHLP